MPGISRIDLPQNLTKLAYESIKAYILRENPDEHTRLSEDDLSRSWASANLPCARR